ncbi:VOC family protein [Collimonas pratensis]|uniref:3-demethylubiquinone-9 3-methyltransferase family protein n=1 Tax=Collimonas pratensis TaxID=279113 RepID=A0A127R303_9BURK|nr:VOC family protein [Collimonas pratensis]AMP06396.1 3-demethylubiquinone-9 3-methyltransferase family protein [Collimonas pratensis]AMP16272.1 3-demethylubiquinone-9 3-methyltransferase family protein [Collimonas pratensis]NKI70603.1 VOC family protein [Collimonas pratensis]
MQLHPYLNFNGTCDAAFKFYEKVLGGKITLKLRFGETPMADQCPPGSQDQIAHVRLESGSMVLLGSDCPPEYFEKAQGTVLSLNVDSIAEAERVFNALKENGSVKMPLEKTFWAVRFAMLTDQFGTPWMVNCEKDN